MQDPTTPLLPLFDKAHADVILRSSDGKDFPMYKLDLSRSSQVFKGMLSALEDQRSDLPPFPKSGLPIIPLAEPADVLEVLLRFCLPRSTPAFTDYAMTARVLEGAQKYEIARAASAACAELERMAEDNPVNIYALACHYNLESLARKAALACLRLPLTTLMVSSVEEMESITAVEFRRLLEYRVSCRSAVAQYLQIAARVPSHQSGQYNLWQCTCRWQRASSGTGGNFQQPWWEICFLELTQKLSECTWEGMVEKDALMQAFLDSESCSRCSKAAASQIDHFTTVTASGVADEIARVSCYYLNVVTIL